MKWLLLFLLILSAFCVQAAWAQTTISIDAKATYLRTNEDPQALNAVPISLDALGIKPGDSSTIIQVGDFSYSIWGWPDEATGACGVFSANSTLLPAGNLHRLPGAIGFPQTDAPPCVSEMTLFGALPTDVPEDFWLDGQPIKVPAGAHYLFVAAADSYYGDNAGSLHVDVYQRVVLKSLAAADATDATNTVTADQADPTTDLYVVQQPSGNAVVDLSSSSAP